MNDYDPNIQDNSDRSDNESEKKRTRNKVITDIEERINYLVENDIQNEEIYKLLKKLALIYINQNKFIYGYNGIEDVCHDVASDVWISVINGRKIKSWMYYIGKMIKLSYVTNQRNIEHEVIITDNDPSFHDNIKRMCASSYISSIKDFDVMERNLMLENIDGIIRHTMSHIKFREGSYEWLIIYCNVCINLVREIDQEKPAYFRIDQNLIPYVDIIMEQFKKDFRNSGFNESIVDNIEEDLEMKLIADETFMKERKE